MSIFKALGLLAIIILLVTIVLSFSFKFDLKSNNAANNGSTGVPNSLDNSNVFPPNFDVLDMDSISIKPSIQWTKTFDLNDDEARSLVQCSDGGFAITGTTQNHMNSQIDAVLIKTDAFGNQQWVKTYAGAWAYSVIQTSDSGYAIAGSTSNGNQMDFLLIKTDSFGNQSWKKTYGGPDFEHPYSLLQTSDGGYILAGETNSRKDTNIWLVKTDSNGNQIFNRTYGGANREYFYSLVKANDGGYALLGSIWNATSDYSCMLLVKTDPEGNQVWIKMYYGSPNSVVQCSDGGFAVFGNVGDKVLLVKTDSSGNQIGAYLGNNSYGGYFMVQTENKEYTFENSYQDFLFVKVDFGDTPLLEDAFSFIQCCDGGYAIAGFAAHVTDSIGPGDFLLAKFG